MSMNPPPPPPHQGYRGSYFAHRRPRAVSSATQFTYTYPSREPIYVKSKSEHEFMLRPYGYSHLISYGLGLNSCLAMDQHPRLAPPIAVQQQLGIALKRNPHRGLSIPTQRLFFQLAQLNDAVQFKHVVTNDCHGMFAQLTELLQQSHDLKMQVTSLSQELEGTRKDYASKRQKYDLLLEMGHCKQMVLWKQIERLQGGLFDGAGLKGAKERFERRELEREKEQEGDGSVKSPKRELLRLGNESPGNAVSVLSEIISEEGCGSPVRSLAGSTVMSLDPSADIFTPRIPAPQQYHTEPSNTSVVLDQPLIPSQISSTDIAMYIGVLPPRLQDVCPISITYETPCPLLSCSRTKLCAPYNDPSSTCFQTNCYNVHEYRTCGEELLGQPRGCSFAKLEIANLRRKGHMVKRVHNVDGGVSEEWRLRTVLAALIPAHLEGRY